MFQSLAAKLAAYKNKFSKKGAVEENMGAEAEPNFQGAEEMLGEEHLAQGGHEDYAQDAAYVENVDMPTRKISVVKIVVVSVVLLLVALIGGGYYYISNIDWNQHKDKIAAEFSNITGKKIVFEGPVNLTLFPSPNLQAENIKIYNQGEESDEPLAQIKSLVADLTLKSVMNGDFDVKMMSLVEPDIRLELLENNKLNWDTPLTDKQWSNLENMQITLDSVLVKNATIHWVDSLREKNYTINNINAEVIAQSIFGPYRIEGTYIKNENPEGFAFSIGKITSGLSTSINAVINQPSTETFVRFDGSVLPQNNAVNGNLIFESKKLVDFINSNSDKYKLKPEYDYPLALTLELKSNKQKIEITNFAAKYGASAGAGNLLIPLTAGEYNSGKQGEDFRPKVEFGFNFASLEMTPIVNLFQELWNKYKGGEANYNPELGFDLLADVKAVKATYNNQAIKDFKVSLDVINNKITVRDLSAVLPGDTAVSLKGDIYSDLGYLTFNLQPKLKTDEFRQTLAWLGITPKISKDTLLRRVNLSAGVAGNFNKLSIGNISLNLDNSTILGEIGLINDKNINLYAGLKTTVFNVDDYFPLWSQSAADVSWAENMNNRFQKVQISPDIYAELRLNADTVIYNSLPYNGVALNGSLQKGQLSLSSFTINDMAGAKLDLKGTLKGFGQKAEVENLKFDLDTKNFNEFVTKMNMPILGIDAKKFKNFVIKGIVTGFADRFATKSIAKLDDIDVDYGGVVELKNGDYVLNGSLELKSPDFVKTVNDLGFEYAPQTYVLGLFNLKTKIDGNSRHFKASNMQFNIGSNTFEGMASYDNINGRPSIMTDLKINRFELDKFFYNNARVKNAQKNSFRPQSNDKIDFLAQPFFDDEKFNFDFLTSFDFQGKFDISRLSYRDWNFDYCKFNYVSQGNVAKLSDFSADFGGGKIKTDFDLSMNLEQPMIKGNLSLENYDINAVKFSGAKYGLQGGKLNLSSRYVTEATSFADMYARLRADGQFQIFNGVMKGWNIKAIYDDLLNRKSSQGLINFVKSKLTDGSETLTTIDGNFAINNGILIINDSRWSNDLFVAMQNTNVSLTSWGGDIGFDIDFIQPDYLPNFSIVYSGSLSAPDLDVNIDDLAMMYNKRQQEIQAKEEADLAAQKEKLRKELADTLLQTQAMESELENVVRPDMALKKQKAQRDDILKQFTSLEQRLDKIEADLSEIKLTSQNPEITSEIIAGVKARNESNQKYINDLKEELKKLNADNLRYSIAEKQKYINQQDMEAEQYAEKYNQQKAELDGRLSQIETTYSLDKDENFVRLDASFQGLIIALNKINEKVNADYNLPANATEFDLDKAFQEVSAFEEDVNHYLPDIKAAFEQLFSYADERVKIAEETYQKQKREAEIKKKLEENTGSISVKGTGVSKTVVRDLEDIEKSEEALENKDTQVLDFNEKEPKIKSVSVVKRSNAPAENVVENTNSVVKKVSGEISKASGVIIKK